MPVQPPNFAPLFVLVDDKSAKGTSTSHPRRVHYLFSDDDASELLTASLLSSMASRPSHMNPDPKSGNSPSDSREMERSGTSRSSSSSATFKLKEKGRAKGRKEKEKERQVERKERVIIVDVDKSGTEVTSVNSVSGRWQVVGAGIEKAPTFEGGEGEGVEGGLMLRIEGLGVEALAEMDTSGGGGGGSARESGTGGIGEDEMRELLEGFDRKMGILRKIVGAREKLAEGS
ncbi:hypothetical protein G7Y89_g4366 [Cudoniella acicularis]|uniref:Uncharacterized protein n=1 Tax=Cudoniella acicularis TaxID=354080 RepID=A0A8H4RSK4_9HELO|nr:hypothetical protein G7Y89_g4366 [Cudoniella acicularis]